LSLKNWIRVGLTIKFGMVSPLAFIYWMSQVWILLGCQQSSLRLSVVFHSPYSKMLD
jgi:hypothetical protein